MKLLKVVARLSSTGSDLLWIGFRLFVHFIFRSWKMPVPRDEEEKDEGPPTDRPSIRLLTDDPGGPVLLKCDRSAVLSVHVLGHSRASVRWFIGQRMVRDCPRYGLSTDGHRLYALVIRQVTEELECGVLVTASSDKGVSSKLIDVKTYRGKTWTSNYF